MDAIRELALKRPVRGSRMTSGYLSKQLGRPVSRKLVRHAFHIMDRTTPQMTKREIIRAKVRRLKPTAINELWETDATYVFCGIDGW